MADEDRKVEVNKDILAPAEGPREELITTAIKFLQNPKVKQSPLSQKKAFLQRKGLTKEEIDLAVQRSGVTQDDKVMQVFPPQPPGQMAPGYPVNGHQQVTALPLPVVPYTKWQKVRDILSVIALAGGMSYAAYKFYKEVLKPWLFGKPRLEDRLGMIEKLQITVVEQLTAVQESLNTFQEQVTKDQEKIQQLSHDIYAKKSSEVLQMSQDTQTINEVKTELSSIKGLLLNRRQFPPTPASTPLLPSWQLPQSKSNSEDTPSSTDHVTPGGDSGNLTDAMAMLNSNDSSRGDNSTTEFSKSLVKNSKVHFSETSISDTSNLVSETAPDQNNSAEVKVAETQVQSLEVTTDDVKNEDDELD